MKKLIFYFIFFILSPAVWADIEIQDAWIREAPPGAMMHAGYFVIKNTGDKDTALVGVSSVGYQSVMMHQTVLIGEQVSMKHLESIAILAGQSVTFQPGGMHLMLMGSKKPLQIGDIAKIVFTFGDKSSVTTNFIIKR